MKQKIRKSLSKRVKITATGKVMRRTQNMRHLRRHKSKAQIRRMKSAKFLTGTVRKKVLKMLGL
ncbi:MAG: 50S ribosomal protein L35 [Microgenomates group bacterium GW2011_GWF2_47_9]|nr:MAG: 50S ribosomal protein L35 [Microgenomates group bacterium GW2011_GWF2_47_9]